MSIELHKLFSNRRIYLFIFFIRSGFRRGAGGRLISSGIRPPANSKSARGGTFQEVHFWPTDPKIFLNAPLAPIYTNFEGERAPKAPKKNSKGPKTFVFFCQFFSKICLRRGTFGQNSVVSLF